MSVNERFPVFNSTGYIKYINCWALLQNKIFMNHSIIIKSCQTCPAHIVMCHNAKTGVTATLLTIIFEPKTAAFHER